MKLPNRENAVVTEAKIVRYLLDLTNENGKAQAKFFLAFGFTVEAWQIMAEAPKQHANEREVTKVEERPPSGVHYVIKGILQTPDGRNPAVRVIWIIDDEIVPRLVSAYPL